MKIGAWIDSTGQGTFRVWGPLVTDLLLHIVHPVERYVRMQKEGAGYWSATIPDAATGLLYRYRLSPDRERPDPASFSQPQGVHGPSALIDHAAFTWHDRQWQAPALRETVIYELHVGTFTPAGTFEAVIPRLKDLFSLGINAIEIMPVAQFPGSRNWGYDGVYPFAVQHSYGGPNGLKQLVEACHAQGMAVILDVVYNHLGPEGNYLREYGPYFTGKYTTPWGEAINFDDVDCAGVRNFFIENALYWFGEYHIDALRLDAIHGIFDQGEKHILRELSERTEALSAVAGKRFRLIAESDLNSSRVIRPREAGGYGLDAQWSDDFHHALHVLLTGERSGYYGDFGAPADLEKALNEGFVYSGQRSSFRGRAHGDAAADLDGDTFVVFSQNHDQVGNRMLGERLCSLLDLDRLKLAAAMVLLSPYVPLLFMGEEYGERAPFLYFVSHMDEGLIRAVREGRKKEFCSFGWDRDPPDPQSEETMMRSRLDWSLRSSGDHAVLLAWYRELIRIRRTIPVLSCPDRSQSRAHTIAGTGTIILMRGRGPGAVLGIFGFDTRERMAVIDVPAGRWEKIVDASDARWHGDGLGFPAVIGGSGECLIRKHGVAVFQQKE